MSVGMGFLLAAGCGFVFAGLLMILLDAHFDRQHAWDRPRFSLSAGYRRLFAPAARTVIVAGLALSSLASPVAGAGVGALLLGLLLWTRWVRSTGYMERRLRREMSDLRVRAPELEEQDLLRIVVLARHPGWGEELAQQIVAEQGSVRGVASVLVRMDRGLSAALPTVRRRGR
jgi:hypothetical protein